MQSNVTSNYVTCNKDRAHHCETSKQIHKKLIGNNKIAQKQLHY